MVYSILNRIHFILLYYIINMLNINLQWILYFTKLKTGLLKASWIFPKDVQ